MNTFKNIFRILIHTEKLNQSVVLNLKVLFKSSVPVCQPGSRPPEPCGVKQQEKSFGRRLAARSRGGELGPADSRHTASGPGWKRTFVTYEDAQSRRRLLILDPSPG